MQYLLMLYGNEAAWPAMPPDEQKKAFAAYMEFNQELVAAGAMVMGAQLKSTHSATTVRATNGKVTTTDGPFAETKEQLGGVYLLECKTLDEVLALAKVCPGVFHGCVEVRPVMFNPANPQPQA